MKYFFQGTIRIWGASKAPPPVGLSWLRPTVGLGLKRGPKIHGCFHLKKSLCICIYNGSMYFVLKNWTSHTVRRPRLYGQSPPIQNLGTCLHKTARARVNVHVGHVARDTHGARKKNLSRFGCRNPEKFNFEKDSCKE